MLRLVKEGRSEKSDDNIAIKCQYYDILRGRCTDGKGVRDLKKLRQD